MLRSTATATATAAALTARALRACSCPRISLRSCTPMRIRDIHSTQLRRQEPLPQRLPLTLSSSTSSYIRPHSAQSPSTSTSKNDNEDFLLYPNFFNDQESRALLSMALWKLDRANGMKKRKRRGNNPSTAASAVAVALKDSKDGDLQDIFNGEYVFEQGHYDSVIHNYRETLLSSIPPSPNPSLISALKRLYSLLPASLIAQQDKNIDDDQFPPRGSLTHLLHLSPDGEILPHVDNLDASGRVIVGVSLGSERILRLSHKSAPSDGGNASSVNGWDVRLTSGSVYVQRDTIRYGYEHSILPYSADGAEWDGRMLKSGHRMSIMIRDAPSKPAKL